MAQQVPLLPAPADELTLREWADTWLLRHYPDRTHLVRGAVRTAMWRDLPQRFIPNDKDLGETWWTRRFQDHIARSLGLVFTDGRDGDRLDVQQELPFDDFAAYSIGKLRLARGDIASIEAGLILYVEGHPAMRINVADTMAQWKAAAGF